MRNRKSMFREKNFKIYIQKKTIHLRSIFTTSQAKCAHVYSITVKQKSKKKKHFLSTFSFNKWETLVSVFFLLSLQID